MDGGSSSRRSPRRPTPIPRRSTEGRPGWRRPSRGVSPPHVSCGSTRTHPGWPWRSRRWWAVPPRLPWRRPELRRVLSALTRMSRGLTPSPLKLPTYERVYAPMFRNWRTVRREGGLPRGRAPFGPWVRDIFANWSGRRASSDRHRSAVPCSMAISGPTTSSSRPAGCTSWTGRGPVGGPPGSTSSPSCPAWPCKGGLPPGSSSTPTRWPGRHARNGWMPCWPPLGGSSSFMVPLPPPWASPPFARSSGRRVSRCSAGSATGGKEGIPRRGRCPPSAARPSGPSASP
jgi:hypothetical protein